MSPPMTDRTMEALKEYEGSEKQLQDEIERIIISRSYSKRIEGYTLEMAIQIMDTIRNRRAALTPSAAQEEPRPPKGYSQLPPGVLCKCVNLWKQGENDYWCCKATLKPPAAIRPQEGGIAEVGGLIERLRAIDSFEPWRWPKETSATCHKAASELSRLSAIVKAQKEALEKELPCEVALPNLTIRRGAKIETLLEAIEHRRARALSDTE